MADWITPAVGLLGVIVGAGIQEFRFWRERKEKYQSMVFEKRIEAHQGAYYWCMRLLKVIRPHRLMKEGGLEAVHDELWKATEWLNQNTLYLDNNSRDKMAKFFSFISKTCLKYFKEERGKIDVKKELMLLFENMKEVLSSIEKGIGIKYLPDIEISGERIDINELWKDIEDATEELIKRKD